MPPPSFSRSILPIEPAQCFRDTCWHIWCGSLVQDVTTGRWHLFYSRWPTGTGFHAWVTHSEIARAEQWEPHDAAPRKRKKDRDESPSPATASTGPSATGCSVTLPLPFRHRDTIFTWEDTDAWDAHCFHNVVVKQYGGRYYMYYMGNRSDGSIGGAGSSGEPGYGPPAARNWWDHRNHQRIGVAVADKPEGPWRRSPVPALDVTPGAWDSLMVSNPAITDTPDGRWMMIYKGVSADGPQPAGGRVLHGVAWADAPDGPFIKHPHPILDEPGVKFGFEDPCLWREGATYYCIVKSMTGTLSPTGESSLILLQSTDGLSWKPADEPLVLGRELTFAGGEPGVDPRIEKMQKVERPQYYEDANGNRTLIVAVLPQEGPSYNVRLAFAREN